MATRRIAQRKTATTDKLAPQAPAWPTPRQSNASRPTKQQARSERKSEGTFRHDSGQLVQRKMPLLDSSSVAAIELTGFQSHTKTRLELGHITVFVGQTDSGKSSILRALNWVRTNRPLGAAFVRDTDKNTQVKISMVDGTELVRQRNKSFNTYQIGDSVLEAMRAEAPEQITKYLPPNNNVQGQFDSPFFLTISALQRAAMVGEAAGLSMIDNGLSKLELWRKQYNRSATEGLAAIQAKERELTRYEGLDRAGELLVGVKDIVKDLAKAEKTVELLSQLASIESDLAGLPDVVGLDKKVDSLSIEITKIKKLSGLAQDLDSISNQLIRISTHEDELQTCYNELKPKECPLCGSEWK